MARRSVQPIVILLANRATRRRVEGGAGSKRFVLGCDPAARHSVHRIHATLAHLHGRIPASGAPAPRSGVPPILAATLRAGTSLARSPPAHGERSCGAEAEAKRRRRFSSSRGMGAVPASGPTANESRRLLVASHWLRTAKRRALLRVPSQTRDSAHAFHCVTHPKNRGRIVVVPPERMLSRTESQQSTGFLSRRNAAGDRQLLLRA